jgi:hypothetical protein
MTSYVKIYPTHLRDPRWRGANSHAFAVHITAISFLDEANGEKMTDGRITKQEALSLAAPGVTPGELPLAIRSLVNRGLWLPIDRGAYQIVDYQSYARSSEEIQTAKANYAHDKSRQRKHAEGDHSLCIDPRHCPTIREAHNAGNHSLCKDRRFCRRKKGAPAATNADIVTISKAPARRVKVKSAVTPTEVYAEWHARLTETQNAWMAERSGWSERSKLWPVTGDGLPAFLANDPEPNDLSYAEKAEWWNSQARKHRAAWVASYTGDGDGEAVWGLLQTHDGYLAFLHQCPKPVKT